MSAPSAETKTRCPLSPRATWCAKNACGAEKEIRERHAPRRQHGTRVLIEITCAQCGKHESLDYMPRGKKLDEILCTGCAGESFGKGSKWQRVRQQKKKEEGRSWKVPCDECGKPIYMNLKPKEDRLNICSSCYFDHVPAGRDATKGAEPVAKGVLKRRSRRVVSMSEPTAAAAHENSPPPSSPEDDRPSIFSVIRTYPDIGRARPAHEEE